MVVSMKNEKITVKRLITALLEMPMDSEIEICVQNRTDTHHLDSFYKSVSEIYTDEYNGKKKVVITNNI